MTMSKALVQWDIVKVRINPNDRDEHPAIIISPPEACADEKKRRINVLYGTTRRPGFSIQAHEVQLNGADGLEHATLFSCGHIYTIDRTVISAHLGSVTHERRRQISRKIIATFRLPM